MKSPIVQSNKNVLKAVQNPDQHTFQHLQHVPVRDHSHFRLEQPTETYQTYQKKQPPGMCLMVPGETEGYGHASVQTDPCDMEFEEVGRLRELLQKLIEKGRTQEQEMQQLRHVARMSVSRQYLDNACAQTPSHGIVDSAISVVRENYAQCLMDKADFAYVNQVLKSKADKETVQDAISRVDKQQRYADAIMLDIEAERVKRVEALQENERRRKQELSKAADALIASEHRVYAKQKAVNDVLDKYADSDSSDDEEVVPSASVAPTVSNSMVTFPLQKTNEGNYKMNLVTGGKPSRKGKAQRPYAEGAVAEEAQKERVKQLETALRVWESASNSELLLNTIEKHIQLALDGSTGARLRGALQQCQEQTQAQKKSGNVLEQSLDAQDKTAGKELLEKLQGVAEDVEKRLSSEDSGVRGVHHRLLKQHKEMQEAMKQIKEMFLRSGGTSGGSGGGNGSIGTRNTADSPLKRIGVSRLATDSIYRKGGRNNAGSTSNSTGSLHKGAAPMVITDAQRKLTDKVAELGNILHLLSTRQATIQRHSTEAFDVLDRAVQSLSEAQSRNAVIAQRANVYSEREQRQQRKAADAEVVVHAMLQPSRLR